MQRDRIAILKSGRNAYLGLSGVLALGLLGCFAGGGTTEENNDENLQTCCTANVGEGSLQISNRDGGGHAVVLASWGDDVVRAHVIDFEAGEIAASTPEGRVVTSAWVSADGARLVYQERRPSSDIADDEVPEYIHLLDVEGGSSQIIELPDDLQAARTGYTALSGMSADGSRVLFDCRGQRDGAAVAGLCLWEAETGASRMVTTEVPSPASSVISSDGTVALVGGTTAVDRVDLDDGNVNRVYNFMDAPSPEHPDQIVGSGRQLDLSADGSVMAIGGSRDEEGGVDGGPTTLIREISGTDTIYFHSSTPTARYGLGVDISEDGSRAAIHDGAELVVLDVGDPSSVTTLSEEAGGVPSFGPAGDSIVSLRISRETNEESVVVVEHDLDGGDPEVLLESESGRPPLLQLGAPMRWAGRN
jgi:dipeptidyl aminopeptidase/acylaminoacyl peptidase